MGRRQGAINQSFGVNAWKPIQRRSTRRLPYSGTCPARDRPEPGQRVTVGQPIAELMRQGMTRAQAVTAYADQFAKNTQQLGDMQANLIAAGPQAVKALQDMGYKGESVSQALT